MITIPQTIADTGMNGFAEEARGKTPHRHRHIVRTVLGEKLCMLRNDSGYAKRFDLSLQAKVSLVTIIDLESGHWTRATVDILRKLARACHDHRLHLEFGGVAIDPPSDTPIEDLIAGGVGISFAPPD